MDRPLLHPHVVWLFGLSGAGKSTLANQLGADLRARNIPVLSLDGDALRSGLCHGLGFADADRSENLRRAAEVACLGLRSNLAVIASFITPLESQRELIARIIGPAHVSFVFLEAPFTVCQSRDVKGLYARAIAGGVPHMTGLSSSFESPARPELTLHTSRDSVESCSSQLLRFALNRLTPSPAPLL